MLHANWHSQLILKSNRKQRGKKSHTHDQFKLTEIKVIYFKQKWLFCTKPFINLLQIMVKIILWDEFRLISAICSVYKQLPYSYDESPPPCPFFISFPQGWGRVKKLIAKAKSLKFYFTKWSKFIGKYKLKVKYNIQTNMEPCKHMLSIQNSSGQKCLIKKVCSLYNSKPSMKKINVTDCFA